VLRDIERKSSTNRLFDAVLRLAIHGGVGKWRVSPKTAYDPHGSLSCLGVAQPPIAECLPEVLELTQQGPYLPEECHETFYLADDLAEVLNVSMDQWAWARLRYDLSVRLTRGGNIADDVVTEAGRQWESWEARFQDPHQRELFLRIMLAVAEGRGSEYHDARLRVGPQTRWRLVDGTIVSLVAAAVLDDLAPGSALNPYHNLEKAGFRGHILAIETHKGKKIHLEPPDLQYEPHLVLMAGYPDCEPFLTSFRIGRTALPRITLPVPGSPIVFAARDRFDVALHDGMSALRELFLPVARDLARLLEGKSHASPDSI
jgi:hypothetical protein